jgi:hypothetical protein
MALPLNATIAARVNASSLVTAAARQVQDAQRTGVESKVRAEVLKTVSNADHERALVAATRALLADVIGRAERATWLDFKSKSDNDCSYFGIYQYQNTRCTNENLSTLQFALDVYERAFELAAVLARKNPDTFGLAAAGIDPKALDLRCTALANPQRPAESAKLTWRGYARLQWYKAVCYVTSAAFWATNVRTGFLYGIGKPGAPGALFDQPDAIGGPWLDAKGDELWAWGPDSVKALTASWWTSASGAGKQLFLPLPTQAFLSASQDYGLDQPWSWGAEGRFVDNQTRAELKRGRSRRSERRAERSREGFYAKPAQWQAFGGGKNQCPKKPWKERLPEIYDPGYALPPDFELALAFSRTENGLVPMRAVVGRGDAAWVMPGGGLLVEYARKWLEEITKQDLADHLLRANLIYNDYLYRFMEKTKLRDVDPSQHAQLRANGDVFTEGGTEYVRWIPSAGLTLKELEKGSREAQKAQSMKVAGSINGVLLAVAAAVVSAAPIGTIVAVVLIVVAALVQLFTWLFGGSLVGCPKAPRPFILRTFDDPRCNADIAKSGQTLDQAWQNLQAGAAQIGLKLSFPRGAPPPPPPALPAGAPDYQFPGLTLPPAGAPKASLLPALVLGGALAAGAFVLLKR